MSAQKTELVCLLVFGAFLANGLVELVARTRAVVSVSSNHVQVSVCMRGDRQESCTFALELETGK